jgi:hypothetical protein
MLHPLKCQLRTGNLFSRPIFFQIRKEIPASKTTGAQAKDHARALSFIAQSFR